MAQLEIAERIEEVAGRIYRVLARHHGRDPEARGLFEQLAAEEDQHVLRVRMVRNRYLRDRDSVGDIGGELSAATATRVVLEAEQLCDRLTGAPGMSLGEAKRLARRLEENMAQAHADMLTENSAPEVRTFLQFLARQDREHARLLAD